MPPADAPLVVLLRNASGPDDPYVAALQGAGFRAACEPVLRFRFPRPDALRERLAAPDAYAGLIVTSPRAVRAIEQAGGQATGHAAWHEKPAYAVGPKTAAALRRLGWAPRGAEAGDAATLASVIAKKEKPYLFLSGTRRRDTLPDALDARGIAWDELAVYETHLRSDLALPEADAATWLVFFSPSGRDAVARQGTVRLADYRLAAIGPTTAAALREQGAPPEAVAATPTPAGVVQALQAATG